MATAHLETFDLCAGDPLDAPVRAPRYAPRARSMAYERVRSAPALPPVPTALAGATVAPRRPGPTLAPPVDTLPRIHRRAAAAATFAFEHDERPGPWDQVAERAQALHAPPATDEPLDDDWFDTPALASERVWYRGMDPSDHPDAPLPSFSRLPRIQPIWALPPLGLAVAAVATAILLGVW